MTSILRRIDVVNRGKLSDAATVNRCVYRNGVAFGLKRRGKPLGIVAGTDGAGRFKVVVLTDEDREEIQWIERRARELKATTRSTGRSAGSSPRSKPTSATLRRR